MGGVLQGLVGGGGGQAQKAAADQARATDMQQAETIRTQVAADAQKQQAERFKIMQDVQTKIFEITQDVTINKCKVASKAVDGFSSYLRA